jgi:hypothetical protein
MVEICPIYAVAISQLELTLIEEAQLQSPHKDTPSDHTPSESAFSPYPAIISAITGTTESTSSTKTSFKFLPTSDECPNLDLNAKEPRPTNFLSIAARISVESKLLDTRGKYNGVTT